MPKKRTITFWDKLELFSPILCRIMARRSPGGPPLTHLELAERSGLSVVQVVAISEQTDWSGIDLPTMRRFVEACGVDFENPRVYRRIKCYLRGTVSAGIRVPPQFTYLRKSPMWETYFQHLAGRWREQQLATIKATRRQKNDHYQG